MRRSSKKKEEEDPLQRCNLLTMQTGMDQDQVLDDEQALMVAHNMFPFCRRAMTDSSVHSNTPDLERGRKLLSCGWENMCKVVEMELSLMYDILYTKTGMVHTWGGYLIRVVSPVATAITFFLFRFYNKDGQRREDVIITYTLLASAFVLDIRWLLRALVSTWTHAFLEARPHDDWLRHEALCSGRWSRFRSVFVGVSFKLVTPRSRSGYRLWLGTVGQYCLLQECTSNTNGLFGRAAKKIGQEDAWNKLYHSESLELSEDTKKLVFERLGKILKSTYANKDGNASSTMKDIITSWGQAATKNRPKVLETFDLAFGHEFQEDILVWHIATQVFLSCGNAQSRVCFSKASHFAEAIRTLSEYLIVSRCCAAADATWACSPQPI
jgi:hypothetical protein